MKSGLRILFLCLSIGAGIAFAKSEDTKYIRVLLTKDVETIDLYIKGKYEIRTEDKNNILLQGTGLNTKLYSNTYGINIAGEFRKNCIIVYPKIGYFFINKRPFRGALIVRKDKNSKLSVINYLNLEDYVKGVLFHEVSHRWPIEALKAQAVAVRTYALYHAKINKDRNYDLTADIYSQVYGGKNSERYRTNRAVELTRGLVLTYKGKVFPAYFHATCAGRTEDADQLWNIDLAPLKSVDCGFCQHSPHFRWQTILRLTEIIDRLNASGYNFNSLEDIQIIARNRSGRVKTLRLKSKAQPTFGKTQSTSGKDTQAIIPAKDFRQILGPKDIRSTNFTLKIVDSDVYFEGFGWGHGVGLCQWGAYFLAKLGYKYQTIVQFYYPDCQIERI